MIWPSFATSQDIFIAVVFSLTETDKAFIAGNYDPNNGLRHTWQSIKLSLETKKWHFFS